MSTSRCAGCLSRKEIYSHELNLCADCFELATKNLTEYQRLCERAEALKKSTEWAEAKYEFTSIWIALNKLWSNWARRTRELDYFKKQIISLLHRYKKARTEFSENYEQEIWKQDPPLIRLRKMEVRARNLLANRIPAEPNHKAAMKIFVELTRLRRDLQGNSLSAEETNAYTDLTNSLREFFFHYRCGLLGGETTIHE